MKWIKWAVIGVLVFSLVFLFLPMGTADSYAMPDTATSYGNSAQRLVLQYVERDEREKMLQQDAQIVSAVGYIYCDKDGNGIESYVNSAIGPRADYTHNGEDIQPSGGWSGYGVEELWAVCPFAGEVKVAGYSAAYKGYGYTVLVQVSPHVDVRYAHLGYGAGHAAQFSDYTTAASLVSVYPFQGVGYPDQWISEPEWCRQNGVSFAGDSLRTVGPSSIKVSVGDIIEAGTVIGVPGDTGNSTGLHAHFELRYVTPSVVYYASISEAISGVALKDLTWHYFIGTTMYDITAIDAGMDLDELNIQIQRDRDEGT